MKNIFAPQSLWRAPHFRASGRLPRPMTRAGIDSSHAPSPALDKKIENASVTIFVLPKISTKNFHARKSWKFQICTIENLYHEFFIERIFKQETQIFEFSYSNTKIR
jgi:hypothetical protein